MTYLLDTDVISELVAAEPDVNIVHWIRGVPAESVFISVITVGDLKRGVEKLRDSRRKSRLSDWLGTDLLVRFANRILPIDMEVALTWGEVVAAAEKAGKPLPAMDSLLAATALAGGLTLVTRNVRDFQATTVSLLNPWEETS